MVINRTNACDQVAEEIKNLIVKGSFKVGERLPTETQLAEMFGVSRAPVREALRALRQAGFLVTKHGIGTFVNVVSPDILGNEFDTFMFFQDQSLIEILQLRRLIEGEAARLAAEHASEADIAKIRETEALARTEILKHREGKDNAFFAADLKFHLAVAEASHNGIYVKFIHSIHQTLHFHQFLSLRESVHHDEVMEFHHGIFTAIAEHNPVKAANVMGSHIRRVEELVAESAKKAKAEQKPRKK